MPAHEIVRNHTWFDIREAKRRLPVTGALAAVAVLAVACEQPVPEVIDLVRPVKMLELAVGQAGQPLEYPGRIAATQEVEIAFEVSGLITELPVTQGQLVQRGQLLAQLDPRDFEAAARRTAGRGQHRAGRLSPVSGPVCGRRRVAAGTGSQSSPVRGGRGADPHRREGGVPTPGSRHRSRVEWRGHSSTRFKG